LGHISPPKTEILHLPKIYFQVFHAMLKVPNLVLEVSYNRFTSIKGQKTR